ncbi:MAG: SRPBCC domain-containing protein [Ornithinimicrobium sp.]
MSDTKEETTDHAPTTSEEAAPEIQMYSIYIEASAERIWEAITTPEFSTRYGYGSELEIDLRPGGAIRDLCSPEMKAMGMGEVAGTGTVIELDPPHRLVQTWSAAWHDEPDTTLTYEITEFAHGPCRLTLTHECLEAPNTAKDVRGGGDIGAGGGGWPWVLSSLKTLLETDRSMSGAGAGAF